MVPGAEFTRRFAIDRRDGAFRARANRLDAVLAQNAVAGSDRKRPHRSNRVGIVRIDLPFRFHSPLPLRSYEVSHRETIDD
jgi:hypothetical protein